MSLLPLGSLLRRPPANQNREPVLLVTPPSIFLLDERVFVALGILRVAAVLEQRGHAVEHLDLNGIENFEDVASIQAIESPAKHCALTITTPQLPAAVKIVARIRAARPDMRIIVGGPHVTLVHSAVKIEAKDGRVGRAHRALEKLSQIFDVLVSGDGEAAIFEALLPDAPKVIDADIPKGGLFMSNADYEETPFPARHLVDMGSYKYSIEGFPATTLIGQLGCPFGCGFCGGRNSSALRKIRTRSTANIVSEIEMLHKTYGYVGFNFFDDELNLGKSLIELMNEITALQKRLGVSFRLRGFVKSELLDIPQAEAMRRAGFRWLLSGFEAASPRILENINKKATLEDNTRVVEIARQTDLKVKALMSCGHPGESEETILAIRDWLIEVKPSDFDLTTITTYPGSPYFDEALPHETMPGIYTYTCKKSRDRLHSVDVCFETTADYYKGIPGEYKSFVFTDHISSEEIVRLRDKVEAEVRETLGIPYNAGQPGIKYEASMGQLGPGARGELPANILRKSA